jgi:pilus assembly protein CpaF
MFGKRTTTGAPAGGGGAPSAAPAASRPAMPAPPPPKPTTSAASDIPAPPPPRAPIAPNKPVVPVQKSSGKVAPPPPPKEKVATIDNRSDEYYRTKTEVFNALIDTIDLSQLAQLDQESAREEIRDIVIEIVSIKNVVMSVAEQETLLEDICNDVLGYGPLEPLLARDDIADIMVNGAGTTTSKSAARSSARTSASATTRS